RGVAARAEVLDAGHSIEPAAHHWYHPGATHLDDQDERPTDDHAIHAVPGAARALTGEPTSAGAEAPRDHPCVKTSPISSIPSSPTACGSRNGSRTAMMPRTSPPLRMNCKVCSSPPARPSAGPTLVATSQSATAFAVARAISSWAFGMRWFVGWMR